MSNVLIQFQEWYASQCNGTWEHSYGVKIQTLDNPGWSVLIELTGTPYSESAWPPFKQESSDTDWIVCSKKDRVFRGCGDPSKLETIIRYFLDCVDQDRKAQPLT